MFFLYFCTVFQWFTSETTAVNNCWKYYSVYILDLYCFIYIDSGVCKLLLTVSASKWRQGEGAAPALSTASTRAASWSSLKRFKRACVAAFKTVARCQLAPLPLLTCCVSGCCCCCCWSCWSVLDARAAAERHSRFTRALRRGRNMNMNNEQRPIFDEATTVVVASSSLPLPFPNCTHTHTHTKITFNYCSLLLPKLKLINVSFLNSYSYSV